MIVISVVVILCIPMTHVFPLSLLDVRELLSLTFCVLSGLRCKRSHREMSVDQGVKTTNTRPSPASPLDM